MLFTSRAGIGNTAILQEPAATNQGFQSMVLHDDINTYFVYSMTDMIKAKAERVASGSTFAEISGKMLGNLEFMFPSKTEQDKIGGYFESLDNLITLHQRNIYTVGNSVSSLTSLGMPEKETLRTLIWNHMPLLMTEVLFAKMRHMMSLDI